jgi:hypothetical protein
MKSTPASPLSWLSPDQELPPHAKVSAAARLKMAHLWHTGLTRCTRRAEHWALHGGTSGVTGFIAVRCRRSASAIETLCLYDHSDQLGRPSRLSRTTGRGRTVARRCSPSGQHASFHGPKMVSPKGCQNCRPQIGGWCETIGLERNIARPCLLVARGSTNDRIRLTDRRGRRTYQLYRNSLHKTELQRLRDKS